MNIFQRLTIVSEQTSSDKVKELCHGILEESKKTLSDIDPNNVLEGINLLDEEADDLIKNLAKDIKESMTTNESNSTKKYAEMLMNGWKGVNEARKPVSGTWKEVANDNRGKVQSLNESNSSKIVSENKLEDLGVISSIQKLASSAISTHPSIKTILEKYSFLVSEKKFPEYIVGIEFVSELKNFVWDDEVKEVYENLSSVINDNRREIEVMKTIRSIQSSGGRDIFSSVVEKLNGWINSDHKSNAVLLKEMARWSFNPHVKSLVSFISLQENINPNKLEIVNSNQFSEVESIYSPVYSVAEGIIFHSGSKFFIKESEVFRPMRKEEVEALPVSYMNLVEAFTSPNVRVDGKSLTYYVGKIKVSMVQESNIEAAYYVNNAKVSLENLPHALAIELGGTFGINENKSISDIMTLAKGLNDVYEIDYAKKIKSKLYEGVYVTLMRTTGSIYIQRVNEGMRENSFFMANGHQTVSMVKDFLGFDISESLTMFLEGEEKIKSIMINDQKKVIESISIIEREINKLEEATKHNPVLASSKEIMEAKKQLNTELQILQAKWSKIKAELKRLEKAMSKLSNISEDYRFNIGDSIRIKESGEVGKIVSIDGFSGTYTVLLERGTVKELPYTEVEMLSSIGKGQEGEEGDLKEGKKTPEKTLADNTEEAPGSDPKTPKSEVTSKMEKAANLEEAPEGNNKKPKAEATAEDSEMSEAPDSKSHTNFKPEGSKNQGYNLR
jgi:hypothetical protein